eukprot:CAMPEP_0194689876 /NCGR_PEP_ID=MMETSP0295-20121207/17922_1 /TAXON_ID=39354 /ORGANISM="Heterosigma akashiwo, Strain CCMP2393" /LENGTH=87 /DNA_ID=CAMNT_0039579101 /DNA_START=589 /DNA_END=848 /DNA_ORIENTATION=+
MTAFSEFAEWAAAARVFWRHHIQYEPRSPAGDYGSTDPLKDRWAAHRGLEMFLKCWQRFQRCPGSWRAPPGLAAPWAEAAAAAAAAA